MTTEVIINGNDITVLVNNEWQFDGTIQPDGSIISDDFDTVSPNQSAYITECIMEVSND